MRGKNATDVVMVVVGWGGGRGEGGGEGNIDVALTIIQNFNGWSFLALSAKKFLACNHVTM